MKQCLSSDCKGDAKKYSMCEKCIEESSQHFQPVRVKHWPVWGGYQVELWDRNEKCHVTKFCSTKKHKNQTVKELSLARYNRWLIVHCEVDKELLTKMMGEK